MWAYFNGEFVPKDDPLVRLEDRGLTFGDGIFEVIRTIHGEALFFEEHLDRMIASAGFFGLPFHYRSEDLHDAARELIRRNGITDGELFLELTRGVDRHRDHRFPGSDTQPTFFMLAFQLRPIPPESWEQGVRVITYPDLRGLLCEHKTLNLLPNVRAKNAAYTRGAYEAVMFRVEGRGRYVTEGGSSSYFCVLGGRVLTPEIDNILPGITRAKVIFLARQEGLEVIETRLMLDALLRAEEVFLASTVSRVMPVRAVDDRRFPAPGPVTRRMMECFGRIFPPPPTAPSGPTSGSARMMI
jgi:D-alanine transaminase